METLSASCIISSKNSLGSSSDSESTVPYLGYQTSTFHGLRSMKSVDKLQLWTTANAYCRKARRRSSQNVISNPFSTIICQNRMRIVFIAAECAPWSKTGGLGDVIGALPPALVEIGHRVMTVTPRYDQYRDVWDTNVLVELKVGDKTDTVRFFHCYRHGVDRVFIDHPLFLEKVCGKTGGKLYGPIAGEDFDDNQLRFSILCQAAIEATRVLSLNNGEDYSGEYGEDVVFVCNDWHTALLPCYLKSLYKENGIYKNAKVVFCIHNISYQGRFSLTEFSYLGLPDSFKSSFYFIDGNRKPYKGEKINWMKAAIIESDKVLTVSPNYASEIVSDAAKGVELDDVLRETGVIGIVNGMDVTEWDPKTDKYLLLNYDKTDAMVSKPIIKEALQAQVGLPVDRTIPLLGFVGRLEEQKGSDILVEAIPEFIGDNVQIVVLGSGKKNMEKQLSQLELKYPDKARGITRFNVPLAHLIVSGADFMLIPSRFEPCGLIQLQAMNNGTIPLATTTGGLPDTIKDGVTGFLVGGFNIDCDVVDPADVAAVAKTVKKAIGIYGTPAYSEMVQNCMSQDLSWMGPAKKWEEILLSLKNCCNKTRSDGEEEFPLVKENVAAP